MQQKTRQRHQQFKTLFCSIKSQRELCRLLKIDQRKLQLLIQQPPYKTFTIPKKEGGERLIETPGAELKKVLSRLNSFLQSVYFFERSNAAYGFILGVRNDDDRRNVLSNAKKHVNQAFLLNIDLKDFFHHVSRERVLQIFQGPPFHFKRQIPDLLADLTTFRERLPMGAPTSPALSNFACRELDEALTTLAADLLWVYTRYADDMSFSSKRPINAEMVGSVMQVIRKYGFEPNQRKVKIFGPDADKIVTGLLVTDKVSLAPDFLPQLKTEIQQLEQIMRAQNEQGQLATRWVEQLKQQVRGRLNFAGFVLKRSAPEYIELKDAYFVAINPPQDAFGAVSWRGFPYNM